MSDYPLKQEIEDLVDDAGYSRIDAERERRIQAIRDVLACDLDAPFLGLRSVYEFFRSDRRSQDLKYAALYSALCDEFDTRTFVPPADGSEPGEYEALVAAGPQPDPEPESDPTETDPPEDPGAAPPPAD